MNTLYQRTHQVFADNAACGSIADLRIRWTANLITAPIAGIEPGETRLVSVVTNGSNFTLNFAARHPLLTDVYYARRITGDTAIVNYKPYEVAQGIYMVYDTRQPGVSFQYIVGAGTSTTGAMIARNENITVLLADLDNTSWPTINSVVEPFNVIFDYLPSSVEAPSPHIVGGVNIPVSGNSFTNTPVLQTSGGIVRPPIAHAFELTGNTL